MTETEAYVETLEWAVSMLLLIAGPEQSNETDIVKRFRSDAARLRILATVLREAEARGDLYTYEDVVGLEVTLPRTHEDRD